MINNIKSFKSPGIRKVAVLGLPTVLAMCCTVANADIPAVCQAAFESTDAVPFTETCRLDAALFSTTLANFGCGINEIDEFCSSLPLYDEEDDGGDREVQARVQLEMSNY